MRKIITDTDTQANCFVSGTLALVLHVSKYVGVAPLNFVKKKTGWRVSVSQISSFFSCFLMTAIIAVIFGTLVCDVLVEQKYSIRMKSNTRRVVWIVDAGIMMVIAGAAVYGAPGHMKCMINYLNHVQKINYELNIPHWPLYDEKRKISISIIWMTLTVVITVIDHVTMSLNIEDDKTEAVFWINQLYILYYLCYWIMEVRKMQFVIITMHLLYTFRAINANLKHLLYELSDSKKFPLMKHIHEPFNKINKECKKSLQNIIVNSITVFQKTNSDGITKPTHSHHQTVRRLALAYAATCDAMREVDRCNGLVLLLLLVGFLLHLVCTPYYLINNLFENKTSESLLVHFVGVVMQLLWCTFHAVNLVMVVEPCHLTHVEMDTTKELVGHLMRCSHSTYDPLALELDLFFRHLVLNQILYSPMKVTIMSRSLVATILSSITTYLVVIIQL